MTDVLPPEIWWKILRLVPSSSLCHMALVCKYFHQLVQDPILWSHVKLRRDVIEREGLSSLLDNPRLSRVTNIDLSYLDLTNESERSLRTIFRRFRRILLRYCQVSKNQLHCIIQILERVTSVNELSLDSVTLSDVGDDDLTKAVTNVNDLDLNNTSMTMSQLNHLLIHIPTSNIQELTLSGQDLSEISSYHLCLPADQVRRLDVSNTHLTGDQMSDLLCSCIWSDNLEELDITGNSLEHVSSQLLLDSVACLTCLNISSVSPVSRKQMFSVLQSVTTDWSTLSSLNLSTLDLTMLPSSLLSSSLSFLSSIKLNYCKMTSEQITSVVRAVAKSNCADTLGHHQTKH